MYSAYEFFGTHTHYFFTQNYGKGRGKVEKRKYKRIKYADRQQIEAMYNSGAKEKAIAEEIGVHIATIYKELERGKTIVADSVRYSADIAQRAIG
jgi:IS30 family transposase